MTLGTMAKTWVSRMIPLGLTAHFCAPVLTYHACYSILPPHIEPIDNVDPQSLFEQLSSLKRRFRFVPVDELTEAKSLKGLASLTFDDAYRGVIENALPVMESLNIPFTVFVNTSTLQGEVHWRHKVVYVINHGLAREVDDTPVPDGDYYRAWKQPHYDSGKLVERIDAVLRSRNIQLENHLFDKESCFVRHPLAWYGNHSHRHYVMSSLSRAGQFEEISACQKILREIPDIQRSQVFALPFGATQHVNGDTFEVVRSLGYKALLMNRGGINRGRPATYEHLPVIERFSPSAMGAAWEVKKDCVKGLFTSRTESFPQSKGKRYPGEAGIPAK